MCAKKRRHKPFLRGFSHTQKAKSMHCKLLKQKPKAKLRTATQNA
jgi:hypothetical protein